MYAYYGWADRATLDSLGVGLRGAPSALAGVALIAIVDLSEAVFLIAVTLAAGLVPAVGGLELTAPIWVPVNLIGAYLIFDSGVVKEFNRTAWGLNQRLEMKMKQKPDPLSGRERLLFAGFFSCYWLIGFALALWVGLGWLMLFQALQSLIFTIPALYLLLVRLLLGRVAAENERSRLLERVKNKGFSPWLVIRTAFAIALTILFFWKINIPIIDFIRPIFGSGR